MTGQEVRVGIPVSNHNPVKYQRPVKRCSPVSEVQSPDACRPVLIESCRLPVPFHGDPADRIIVATARDREAVLVTKDRQIHQYAHVRVHW